jgi:hypothetical protein
VPQSTDAPDHAFHADEMESASSGENVAQMEVTYDHMTVVTALHPFQMETAYDHANHHESLVIFHGDTESENVIVIFSIFFRHL